MPALLFFGGLIGLIYSIGFRAFLIICVFIVGGIFWFNASEYNPIACRDGTRDLVAIHHNCNPSLDPAYSKYIPTETKPISS